METTSAIAFLYLVYCAGLGLIPAFIAKHKGRNFALWWLYGAAFFLIALIHSFCLSKTRDQRKEELKQDIELREEIKEESRREMDNK